MNKTTFGMLMAGLIALTTAGAYAADSNRDQQAKDQENKERIYGTKRPWENTAPYGTEYVPPQNGVAPAGANTTKTDTTTTTTTKPVVKTTTTKSAKKTVKKKAIKDPKVS